MRTDREVRLIRGTIATVDASRRVIDNGAVAIDGPTIVAVDTYRALRDLYPDAQVSGSALDLVVPGYINGHQHLTGDRLIQSVIPDDLEAQRAIFDWVLPVHRAHTGDDDELSATLTLAESLSNGVTTTCEAGTVAHPARVVAAARKVGARLMIGSWGWDVGDGPYAGPVDEVLDRQRAALTLADDGLISAWVSLVGHDLMTDEMVVSASDLAIASGTSLTFHLSPGQGDVDSYLGRTGKRPFEHLRALGVLGKHVVAAHAVQIDAAEVAAIAETGTSVVSCPWAYLRLGQGMTREFAHFDLWRAGGRLALGCDAENAGDMVDAIRTASLFAGIAKDTRSDPTCFTAHDALELLTIRGAAALGIDDRVGSLEVGKQADIVVHDRSRIEWIPPSPDPVLQLIWGSDGRSVSDVFVQGDHVVASGALTKIAIDDLASAARSAGISLLERSGIDPQPRWPRC